MIIEKKPTTIGKCTECGKEGELVYCSSMPLFKKEKEVQIIAGREVKEALCQECFSKMLATK